VHLAQVNVGTLRHRLDDPRTAPFVDALDEINALGEVSPGFVWRLQSAAGDATDISVFDDEPLTIINLTVWESVEALRAFAYRGLHRDFFRRRAEWFEPEGKRVAMWWVPAGSLPTVADALTRLTFLERWGPSPFAFPIGAPPDERLVVERVALDDRKAQTLIAALDRELTAMYPEPGANSFELSSTEVADGAGGFLVASIDAVPVACGAYRRIDGDAAEIKRMYVDPERRGRHLGAAVLAAIELVV